jgi:UDP-glucose:(heptosyl)LPS alpha-1,3-glucosyltransferase
MFAVLFVGADYRLKGLLPLLQGAQAVAGSLKILAVGVRPDRDLRNVVEREGLSHLVDFLGPRMDMPSLYSAADCFALPTRYDTFSLVTLEAMASGLPVIVSKRAGVAEILTPDLDSLVLEEPNDVPMLARHLQQLFVNDGLRNNLGAEARKTAERHSWDQVALRTLEVYHETLASS